MFIEVKNVSKNYPQSEGLVHALKPMSFSAEKNETVALIGPSGSGKTTLLSLLAGLDTPTSGSISIGDKVISDLSEKELGLFRSHTLGIVFQQFHLKCFH